jgi:UDP-glucose 4-epimerase
MSGTVLVTGGAGYIGAHACKALAQAGYLPVTYDNLSTGHEWAVRWGPLERGDVLDRGRLDRVIAKYRPNLDECAVTKPFGKDCYGSHPSRDA